MRDDERINPGIPLHEDMKRQVEEWLEFIDDRIGEINIELKKARKLELEKDQLVQQREHLVKVIGVKPSVKVSGSKKKKPTIADHVFDILRDEYPRDLHWKGIYSKLVERGIGRNWKYPDSSICDALGRDDRFARVPGQRGCWQLRKEAHYNDESTEVDRTTNEGSGITEAAIASDPEKAGRDSERN